MRKILIVMALCTMLLITTYFLVNQAPSDKLAQNEQVFEIFDNASCLSCHSETPDLPFYSNLPIIGEQVKLDAKNGLRFIDLEEPLKRIKANEVISESDLSMLEFSAQMNNMPPTKFNLMHWGAAINKKEQEILIGYFKKIRKEYYSNTLNHERMALEPISALPDLVPTDSKKVMLGDYLFHSTALSADNTISCASCHGLETGGVDNDQYSEGVEAKLGGINAPTVYNAHFNFIQFWDGRAEDLAEQAAGPPLNPIEMASENWEEIAARLTLDKAFSRNFLKVYPKGYTGASICDAIAEYESTLITPNSKFDQYLKGNMTAINEDEKEGYKLFKDYGCATCHNGINVGGSDYHAIGIENDYMADRMLELNEDDLGRYKHTKKEQDMYRYKTPTLRNIALTYPYFHDGTIETLELAIQHMGYYQHGDKIDDTEIEMIKKFLEALTGEFNGKILTNTNKVKMIPEARKNI